MSPPRAVISIRSGFSPTSSSTRTRARATATRRETCSCRPRSPISRAKSRRTTSPSRPKGKKSTPATYGRGGALLYTCASAFLRRVRFGFASPSPASAAATVLRVRLRFEFPGFGRGRRRGALAPPRPLRLLFRFGRFGRDGDLPRTPLRRRLFLFAFAARERGDFGPFDRGRRRPSR